MDFNSLKRSSEALKSIVKLKDDVLSCTEDIKIVFPARYVNRELASFDNGTSVLGVWAYVDSKGNYSLSNVPGMINITPNNISIKLINDQEYYICEFEAGGIISPHFKVLQTENIMYILYDDFFVRGNIPVFFNYSDLTNISINATKYSGSKLSKYKATFELLVSIVAKDPADKNSYYRHSDVVGKKIPKYIGLSNVFRSIAGTLSKISGSYQDHGILVAVSESESESHEVTRIEKILLA